MYICVSFVDEGERRRLTETSSVGVGGLVPDFIIAPRVGGSSIV